MGTAPRYRFCCRSKYRRQTIQRNQERANGRNQYYLCQVGKMKRIILKIIKTYQKTISPNHGVILFGSAAMRCRFYPSCSQYAFEAVSRYGVLKGALKGLWRILRCSPLSKGGVDLA